MAGHFHGNTAGHNMRAFDRMGLVANPVNQLVLDTANG